jgi:dihydroxy-acid dehydratase
MSGTGFGTVILHVSPEAAEGGTLGIIQDGDIITLDVHNRSLQVELSAEEIESRKAGSKRMRQCSVPGLCASVPTACRAGSLRCRL